MKDILRVIVWARENGVRVRRLKPQQIQEALSTRMPKDIRNQLRLKIYNAGVDGE